MSGQGVVERVLSPLGSRTVLQLGRSTTPVSGNAAIVSEREATDASSWVIEAAYRPAGAGWEAGVELSTPGDFSSDPAVVLDAPGDATAADGDATAVWVTETRHICSDPRGPFKEECGTDAGDARGYAPEGL